MAPIAPLDWVYVGLAGQQCFWIDGGGMNLVVELDAAKISLRPLPAELHSTKALARAS